VGFAAPRCLALPRPALDVRAAGLCLRLQANHPRPALVFRSTHPDHTYFHSDLQWSGQVAYQWPAAHAFLPRRHHSVELLLHLPHKNLLHLRGQCRHLRQSLLSQACHAPFDCHLKSHPVRHPISALFCLSRLLLHQRLRYSYRLAHGFPPHAHPSWDHGFLRAWGRYHHLLAHHKIPRFRLSRRFRRPTRHVCHPHHLPGKHGS